MKQIIAKNARLWMLLPVIFSLSLACEIEDGPDFGRVGDDVRFSGWEWYVKSSPSLQGPGPNLFSDRPEDIFIDGNGYLHMRIAEYNGSWYSTEVVSYDTVGYGEYTWVVSGDYENIPENIVVRLFTWNTESFAEEANSEVDIEFAKWNNPDAKTLHTSVQPVNRSDTNYHAYRTHEHDTDPGDLVGVTTHQFIWTDSLITWRSWKGNGTGGQEIAFWEFSDTNRAVPKVENGLASRPIVIPAPLNNTNVRMNFWMLGGIPPSDGQIQELVIRNFDYVPY